MKKDIRSLTLWEACVWAYRQQRAHLALRTAQQAFAWAHSTMYAHDEPDTPRPTVHWDAAMLHAAVLELGPEDCRRVVQPAALADRPEIPTEIPRPGCREATHTDREHWSVIDGKRVWYSVEPFRHATERREIVRRRGRKLVVEGVEFVKVPVDPYCPLRWDIDPGEYASEIAVYGAWSGAMARLTVSLKAVDLREHRVEPEIIPPPPPATTVYDSWSAARRDFEPVEARMTKGEGFGLHWDPDGTPRMFERVASARLGR